MTAPTASPDSVQFDGKRFFQSRKAAEGTRAEGVLSKTERLREIWQKTAKIRIGVGIALMAWSAVAASSWAFAVVGWIAAIRAWMAWTGAFLAVDGLLRSFGIEKNAATVALAVGVSVGAILAMPVVEAAEIIASGGSSWIPSQPIPVSPPSVLPPAVISAPPLTPETVREIFSDIRADHPGQSFVTLEQSVRRAEWLAKGIPLSESARLPSEISNVRSLLSDPSWKIAKAMEKLWFLPSEPLSRGAAETWASIDSVARKLTSENLEKVLLEAYGKPSVPDSFPISGTDDALHDTSGHPVVSAEAAPDMSATVMSTPVEVPNRSRIGQFAALLALPAGIAAYLGWRRTKKRPKSEPSVVPAANDMREPVTVGVAAPMSDPEPVYPALSLAVADVLSSEYGFEEAVRGHESVRPAFRLPTPAWEFIASVVNSSDGTEFRFAWTESWKERYVSKKKLTAFWEPDELRDSVRRALEDAYFETAVVREKAKSQEFRDVRTFEVSKRDAADMYRQLEDPETVARNRETGGFWFWSGYGVKDGVFRFGNLANPTPGQIDSTSVEFAIRGEHWESYVSSNLSKAFRADFPPGERKLFMNAAKRAERENPDVPSFPLALDFFNWHKHPGAPLGPSGGDINHPDSASGKFEDSPTLPAVTFAIANEMNPLVRIAGEGMPNSRVLKGSDFEGERDYLVTFWKLLRISDAERVRREAFVAKVWKSKAASLGICDRNGRLLHLDRDVRTGEGVFEADLRPVGVRIFDERK